MGIRRQGIVLLALLVPGMAGAHEHNRAVFVGPSGRTGGSMLWGVHGTYEEVKLLRELLGGKHSDHSVCKPSHWSLVFDASAHFRSHDGFAITAGPSYTFAGCPVNVRGWQFVPSVHVLPGGFQKVEGATDESWRIVGVLGVQLDLLPRRQDGIRIQVDALRNWGGDHEVNYRFSVGLVLRFFDHP